MYGARSLPLPVHFLSDRIHVLINRYHSCWFNRSYREVTYCIFNTEVITTLFWYNINIIGSVGSEVVRMLEEDEDTQWTRELQTGGIWDTHTHSASNQLNPVKPEPEVLPEVQSDRSTVSTLRSMSTGLKRPDSDAVCPLVFIRSGVRPNPFISWTISCLPPSSCHHEAAAWAHFSLGRKVLILRL